jgi:hypothetical protein
MYLDLGFKKGFLSFKTNVEGASIPAMNGLATQKKVLSKLRLVQNEGRYIN